MIFGLTVVIQPYLALVLILGLVGFSITFHKMKWGYALIIFFLPFMGEEYSLISIGGAELHPSYAVGIPVFLSWFVKTALVSRQNPFVPSGFDKSILVFFWWALASLAWSLDKVGGVSKLIQFGVGISLVYLSMVVIETEKDLKRVMVFWILAGALSSVVALATFEPTIGRAKGLDTAALNMAERMNYCLLMAITFYFVTKKKYHRLLILCMAMVMAFGYMTAGARMPLFAIAIAIVYFFFMTKKIKRSIFALLFLLIILIGFGYSFGIGSSYFKRLESLFLDIGNDPGAKFRLAIWNSNYHIIKDHPITGVGIGGLEEAYTKYSDYLYPFFSRGENPIIAHNIYLEILTTIGLIGLVIFLIFIITAITAIIKQISTAQTETVRFVLIGGMSILIMKAISGLTYGTVYEDLYLWATLGAMAGAMRINKKLMGDEMKKRKNIEVT